MQLTLSVGFTVILFRYPKNFKFGVIIMNIRVMWHGAIMYSL